MVATATTAEIVQKPEVRRAGGVYYTPEYIVREIVDLSVSRQIEQKNPDDLEHYRVCDLACGSGSFLLGLYDRLLRHYTAFYNQAENRRLGARRGCIRHEDGSLHLPLLMRREILLRHVFGVDIDPQAVEVAQLSLYLKLLEEETTASARQNQLTLREALLPSLSDNIKCGNALVEWDDISESMSAEDRQSLSPMTFSHEFRSTMRAGGFDAIIGNPPYDVLEKDRGKASWPHDLLRVYVREEREFAAALGGKLNLFRFFVVRAMTLVRQGGRVSMIVPLSLLADVSCSQTRRFLLTTSHGLQVKCFPQKDDRNRRVFKDAKLSTMIFATEKRPPSRSMDTVSIFVYPGRSLADPPKKARVHPADAELLDPENLPLPLADGRDWELCVRIHRMENVIRLGQMDDYAVRRGEVNQKTLEEFISGTDTGARLLKGTEVARYFERDALSQGAREWFMETAYLEAHAGWEEVSNRRIALQRITGIDERFRLVGTIIEPPCYFADSTNSIRLSNASQYTLEYLLCILNSSLFQWRFKVTSTNNNVGTNELNSLPIRVIDFENPEERRIQAAIIRKVTELATLRAQYDGLRSERERGFTARRAAVLDEQLDELVAELYELTPEEAQYMSQMVARGERSRTF
ncbi:MAG: Eco57I restriction-modification methylase domain-containing protein [Acidobacteriaceae bacterium]